MWERERYKNLINFIRENPVDSPFFATLSHFAYLFNAISFRFRRYLWNLRNIFTYEIRLFLNENSNIPILISKIASLSPQNYSPRRVKKAVTRSDISKTVEMLKG